MSNPDKTQSLIKQNVKNPASNSMPVKKVQKGLLNTTVIIASFVSAILAGYVVNYKNEKIIKSAKEDIVNWKAEVFKLKTHADLARKPASVVKPDIEQELKEFIRKCDEENSGESCYKAHELALKKGDITGTFLALKIACVRHNYELACRKGSELIAFLLLKPEASVNLMVEFGEKLCDLGDTLGCRQLSGVLQQQGKEEEALKYVTHGCNNLKDSKSCVIAGDIYYNRDTQAAYKFLSKACGMGYALGCSMASNLSIREGLIEQSDNFKNLACKAGDQSQCDNTKENTRLPAYQI